MGRFLSWRGFFSPLLVCPPFIYGEFIDLVQHHNHNSRKNAYYYYILEDHPLLLKEVICDGGVVSTIRQLQIQLRYTPLLSVLSQSESAQVSLNQLKSV